MTLNRRENGPTQRVLTLAAARSYKAVTSVRRRYPYPLPMSALHVSPRSWHSAGQAGHTVVRRAPGPAYNSAAEPGSRKASPGTWGRFRPAFGTAWKVHSRRAASCAPRRDLDTCQFVPGGSRQRPVLPSLTVSPRGAGQARRAHGSCISIQYIRLLSHTLRRPFYREHWARQRATSTCPSPGNIPAREKGN